jgi:Low molecular weight phosphotyrosine protein phosphatase
MTDKKRVLILCTGNSARSQMAEGLLRHEAGDQFEVYSAGTKPSIVRREAVAAMNEIGIDISGLACRDQTTSGKPHFVKSETRYTVESWCSWGKRRTRAHPGTNLKVFETDGPSTVS